MSNAARYGRRANRAVATATAAACTSTAGPIPQFSSAAITKQTDGNTGTAPNSNGPAAHSTARAATSQNPAGARCRNAGRSARYGALTVTAATPTAATYPKKAPSRPVLWIGLRIDRTTRGVMCR